MLAPSMLSRRPLLLLHVGPHKTGSTYLQKRLAEGRSELARQGVAYPEYAFSLLGHHEVVDHLRGWKTPTKGLSLESLHQHCSTHEVSIISSENFVFLSEEQLVPLARIFESHRIHVVFYLRSLIDIWPSHWQELIKHGAELTFAEYMATAHGLMDKVDLQPIRYDIQLQKLANVFGISHLRVVSYDNVLTAGADLFSHFCRSILGVEPPAGPIERKLVNPSFPPERTELLRLLNYFYRKNRGTNATLKLRQVYLKNRKLHEDRESYKKFCNEFNSTRDEIALRADGNLVTAISEHVIDQFGSCVINRINDCRILAGSKRERVVPFGNNQWIYEADSRHFVDEVLAQLITEMP